MKAEGRKMIPLKILHPSSFILDTFIVHRSSFIVHRYSLFVKECMRKIVVAVALLIASSARAGLVVTRDDGVRISIEGNAFRIDRPAPSDGPIFCDSVVSRDGDKNAACLNSSLHTWFESPHSDAMDSRRFGIALRAKVPKPPKIEVRDETSDEIIAGHATDKHVVRVSYQLVEEDVRQSIGVTILVWTARDLPSAPMRSGVTTSFSAVDEPIAAIFDSFKGMVLKQTLSATDIYEGGKPFTDTKSWTATSIETKSIPESAFEVPKSYRHELPRIVAPGK
jgi:hypothetical protein